MEMMVLRPAKLQEKLEPIMMVLVGILKEKCVKAEQPIWEEYLKSHQDAEQFRFKTFPFYEELCTAFGKDCASGKDAETSADVMEELEREATTNANENVTIEDSDSSASIFATTEE
ncbi:hypothetical protein JCGZ_00490 [Jatropha curcas]|uniref:Uncharacterized protein n=1 Tax=Jatropha curcas TaxID=180498 RepID=A0A067L2W2_JATCU|nr:hypothetical protein JCGZ_00490 [Jatropha curcas]